ncbi:ankyrin repeat domain-containing protein [Belliella marina]|uniref:Ankyrin repeat domain-containing protein n=1 Tax=Belliella marina TaxID=1644146 RepID=A0ABW4VTN2_9BACT
MSEAVIKEALKQRDFLKLEVCIKEDPNSFDTLLNYEKDSLIQGALKQKAFSLILVLMEKGLVITDVFELDKWMGSFIFTVLSNTPFLPNTNSFQNHRQRQTVENMEEMDEESLGFFRSFISVIENIDESVENQTMLELAISKNLPIPVLQVIVDSGCPANRIDHSENTLLFQKLSPQVGSWLIGQGLDVNHKNKGNVTPLEKAIDNDCIDLIKVLLENGADPQHKNKVGNSMFCFALVDKVSYEVFDLLCEYDAPDFGETNKTGGSLLFEFIHRISYVGDKGLQYLSRLLEMGADLNQICTTVYGEEKTPLEAGISKDFKVFEILLNHLPDDINQTDNDGNTLLHKVCAYDLNFDQAKAKELYQKVKLLLSKGADPGIRNTADKTATDLATTDNLKEKTVALLLKNQVM